MAFHSRPPRRRPRECSIWRILLLQAREDVGSAVTGLWSKILAISAWIMVQSWSAIVWASVFVDSLTMLSGFAARAVRRLPLD